MYTNKLFENYNKELNESTKYNTKSKEEFENIEDFKEAINDDINTITNILEDLKYKVNTDEAVISLEDAKASLRSSLLDKAYN